MRRPGGSRTAGSTAAGSADHHEILAEDSEGNIEGFDEVVFACDAEAVLRTLQSPTWSVRKLNPFPRFSIGLLF